MDDEAFRREVQRTKAELVERAVAYASGAAVEAIDTIRTLMQSAQSETVSLAAAKTLLQIALPCRGDPFAAGVHRATTISPGSVTMMVEKMVGTALTAIPDEQHTDFLAAIEKL
jgi:hypothetical protein